MKLGDVERRMAVPGPGVRVRPARHERRDEIDSARRGRAMERGRPVVLERPVDVGSRLEEATAEHVRYAVSELRTGLQACIEGAVFDLQAGRVVGVSC